MLKIKRYLLVGGVCIALFTSVISFLGRFNKPVIVQALSLKRPPVADEAALPQMTSEESITLLEQVSEVPQEPLTSFVPLPVVSVQVVNRRGTTGNPLYHDGLPSANELTDLTFNSQNGNTIIYDYYFLDKLSIPSYGRQAQGLQKGQLIVTITDNLATIEITGGVPEVTNTGSDPVTIQSYSIGDAQTINWQETPYIQGLIVQQSFGQSPLGSIDNLAADYSLSFD